MKKIKILHLLHKLTCGGMENGVVNLVNGMEYDRFSSIICSLTTSDEYQSRVIFERRNIYNLKKKDGNDLTIPFKIAAVIRKENIDIVHSRGWGTYLEGIVAAKLLCRKIKFIFSFHGKTIHELQHMPERRLRAQKFMSFFTDIILTLSEQMAQDYASMINITREKIRVIYNGVDTDMFTSDKCVPDKLKKELKIGENDFVVGFVGRIDPVKDIKTLIDAVYLVRPTIENIKIVIVGEGSEKKALEDYAINKGMGDCLIFTGQRDDIPAFLNMMDIYVQPSLYEGMSNTIIEAMACGCAVIATNAGGNSELIEHDKDGILFKPGNADELSGYIRRLYKDPIKRNSLAERSCEKAKGQFSLSSMVRNYENLYMDLVN
jgi:sugar transferase (PEP-CTERM/EpsH1 system associated)